MKNNNALNNSNQSFLTKNKNMVVFGIIVLFMIIMGIVLYKGKGLIKETEDELEVLTRYVHAPVSSSTVRTKQCGDPAKDPGNVNLLDNIRDKTIKDNLKKEQVYNISNNIFSYEDARAACKSHGGDLATYDQVLETYKKGGEWCNYGWSENQMALYPTQKDTWEELQKDPENMDTCGNWGVNGGYFDNPNTLFGANCYGIKPEPKDREQEKILAFTSGQKIMLDKINMYKKQRNELTVAPFNKNVWSEKGKLN